MKSAFIVIPFQQMEDMSDEEFNQAVDDAKHSLSPLVVHVVDDKRLVDEIAYHLYSRRLKEMGL
jgi:hypothetical protein